MTDLIDTMRRIGIRAPKESLEAMLSKAIRHKPAPAQLLEELCSLETRERDAINLNRRTHYAAIGSFKDLASFDWAHPRTVPRQPYEQLLTGQYIRSAQNVLLRGPSGVGKTTLAKNLCHAALAMGFRVRFTTLSDMLADLLRQESVPAFERRLRRYVYPHLLCIDELGYLPADAKAADTLYHVINRRHEIHSTIITTNLPYKQWTTVFPSASCVGALVDRFAQYCHVLDIDADSWRAKDADAFRTKRRPKGKPSTDATTPEPHT